MPPQLALFICLILMGYLFWMDLKRKEGSSNELWIPLIWMFLAGSRYASSWLKMTPSDASYEGSPLDALVFGLLIGGGLFILSRRKIDWNRILIKNKWVLMYFLYCGISIMWSDDPFVSFKRLIKELGSPIMVLVILTDARPYEAITLIIRRLAFLWLPLSIVFYKYYPALGRQHHESTGEMFATGVSMGKNGLGMLCLVCGIYFSWKYLVKYKDKFKWNWQENISDFVLIGLTGWLLYLSQSATALTCLVGVVFLFFLSRIKLMIKTPDMIIVLLIIGSSLFVFLDMVFDIKNIIYGILGRDESLTTRVPIWEFLMSMDTNPIIGTGYYSFWSGERLQRIWGFTGRTINQAHNGYLEQYLNLGFIGIAFIGAIILSGLLKIRNQLNRDYALGLLCLSFIITALLCNYTEALFYGINNIWFLTLFAAIEISEEDRRNET